MQTPTFHDVLKARNRIRPYLPRTPLHRYPALDTLLSTTAYVKHENYQPVGAFKVRGGVNLVSQLSPDERERGVISASTGNHGQSVAYSAQLFGVKARIVVPEGANPGKVAAMQGMGAEVLFCGANFDAARRHCEELAAREGYRYVHSGNEPLLIAGVATATLEILEDQPDIEVLFVPIGGGSGAAGACLVAKAVNPNLQVIAAQAEKSPAACESWRTRRLVDAPNETFAEGLATGSGFALPQSILWESLSDCLLLTEEEILRAMAWMVERAHTLTESAGAASLAAAYQMRDRLQGKKIALICSGGNTSVPHLQRALQLIQATSPQST